MPRETTDAERAACQEKIARAEREPLGGPYADPTTVAVKGDLDRLLGSPSAGASASEQAAAAVYSFLASAFFARVVASDEVYMCPVCGFSCADWLTLKAHRGETGHARSVCDVCDGPNGVHLKRNCPGSFDGPVWGRADFVMPRAEFMVPATRQWACPLCPSHPTFTTPTSMAGHMKHTHAHAAQPQVIPRTFLPRRHVAGYERGLQPWRPGDPKRIARLLYQCPDCRYLFSSWSQWEHHVRVTKHSQPFCCDCGKIVGKFSTETTNHMQQTGHLRMVGPQPSKESHLRLVDSNVARYDALLDSNDAQSRCPGESLHFIYQCPDDTCSRIFATGGAFDFHVAETQHGVAYCSICRTSVEPRDLASHPHAIPDLPACLWVLRDPAESSCMVEADEPTLLAYFPDELFRCPDCTLVMFRYDAEAHADSDHCIATRGVRQAAWEHWERYRATEAAKAAQLQQDREQAAHEGYAADSRPRGDAAAAMSGFRHFAQAAVNTASQRQSADHGPSSTRRGSAQHSPSAHHSHSSSPPGPAGGMLPLGHAVQMPYVPGHNPAWYTSPGGGPAMMLVPAHTVSYHPTNMPTPPPPVAVTTGHGAAWVFEGSTHSAAGSGGM